MSSNKGICSYCEKSTQYSIRSRRCFMTGGLCSKQNRVHKQREELHAKNEINAFVVMNFSEMSDVVYKWKLRPFIESLKKFLFLKKEDDKDHPGKKKTTAIGCVANDGHDALLPQKEGEEWVKVEEIHVIRADSDTESNYVICDRVCQQMQIADLIIVDVSVENTNVFYEFGMAAAFGKLILPICYNESFYQMHMPEGAREFLENKRKDAAQAEYPSGSNSEPHDLESVRKMLEHHIDSYPWRRKLFEYYGIRFRKKKSNVGYTNFRDITNPVFGFSDVQYTRFPYDHPLEEAAEPEAAKDTGSHKTKENPYGYDVVNNEDRKKVGYHLYNRLRASYNQNTEEEKDEFSPYNTLVVYTMDSVMNSGQAGQCIINYYMHMTKQIQEEYCFCGDRVAILGQSNKIHDDPKDTKTEQKLMYKVSDIIRIGMNEATHMAMQQKIKTDDYLSVIDETDDNHWSEETLRCVKGYVRNRCIPAYPDEPIYVEQLINGVQKGILTDNKDEEKKYFFCLFHVMLRTLRYTNEIVVDLSRNSLQALFWLGVAHGSDAHAITVRHVPTEQELKQSGAQALPDERHIFDVAGLWTAILSASDTDGFYQQLAKAQIGIEQSNKLLLPDLEKYREQVLDQYYAPSPYMKGGYTSFEKSFTELSNKAKGSLDGDDVEGMLNLLQDIRNNKRLCGIWETLTKRNQLESDQLESYYRTCFWRRMLRQNALHIYIPEKDGETWEDKQPRRVNISWDVSATAELSHYLSKRMMIGSYRQTMLRENGDLPDVQMQNFISIGNDTKPFESEERKQDPGNDTKPVSDKKKRLTLVEYAREQLGGGNSPRKKGDRYVPCGYENNRQLRGFFARDGADEKEGVYKWFPTTECIRHMSSKSLRKKGDRYVPRGYKKMRQIRGFFVRDGADEKEGVYKWFPTTECIRHMSSKSLEQEEKRAEGNKAPDETKCAYENKCKNQDNCYSQLGQLLLWRKPTDESRKEMRFWVSLVGVSGPATLALTTLLVNPEQQEELFCRKEGVPKSVEDKTRKHLLNSLQTGIREEFRKKYNSLLEKQLDGKLLAKVKYATNLYLSTVLYQYFFPFLTISDEMRIKNGMEAFLAADRMGLEKFDQVKQKAIKALEDALGSLYGVEALYNVTVAYQGADSDSRWPKGIEPLKNEVCCLFKEEKTRETNKT